MHRGTLEGPLAVISIRQRPGARHFVLLVIIAFLMPIWMLLKMNSLLYGKKPASK
jgi:hypothetical protein